MLWIIENPVKATGFLVAIALAVIAVAIKSAAGVTTLNFVPATYDVVVNILTPIFFVALLVERAVEVFVVSSRKIERNEKERGLQLAQDKIAQLRERIKVFQAQLDAPGAERLQAPEIKAIQNRIDNVNKIIPEEQKKERKAAAALEAYRSRTRPLAFFAAVLLGLIVAISGMRVVAHLVNLEPAPWPQDGFQAFLFHSLDVVLTAGLLAGGASGIHQILTVFGEFTTKTRKSVASTD